MIDPAMQAFADEMRAKPRAPRHASTRRSGEIDNSSAPGAAALARYRFVDALPKNNYGKVLKTELRRVLAQPANGGDGDELPPNS